MSTTVDNRVVELQFDNRQFESNVKTTMSTLDKLKQSLNFKSTSKGLDDLGSAASKCNLSGLTNGISEAQNQFSALQVIGVTALATLTNQAVNAGQRIVKSLTIGSAKDGFGEYETQMNAIQTILANTQKEGTNVAIVNKYLDELNEYADKTIYNFTEMTRNIGTFTAAGVKLDTSVTSIKGIANLAAISGSTSQQASTAMYQLSQAIASGTVKLMDWNSVVNAGMGGQVFQDALLRTSELLGTGGQAAIDASGSFRESLRDGWLTVDVLTQTLDMFATAAETEEEYAEAVKKFVSQGYTEDQAKQMADMAKTAGEAATKVKTFTQLIDTCKEAMGSGWAQTWRIIFGDFEQARTLWSSVSDVLSGLINSFSEARNSLLESALGKSFTGLAEKVTGVLEPALDVADAVSEVTTSMAELGAVADDVLLGVFGNGQERFDALTESGLNYYRIQNEVNKKLGDSYRYTEEQIAAQDKLLGTQTKTAEAIEDTATETVKLTDEQKKQIKELAKLSNEQLKAQGYTEEQIAALQELRDTAKKLGVPFDEFIDKLDEINGRWFLIRSFENIGKAIGKVFGAISTALKDVFAPIQADQIFNLITGFHKLTAALNPSTATLDKITRTFKGLFAAVDLVTTIIGGGFKIAFEVLSSLLGVTGTTVLDLTAKLGDLIYAFNEWFQNSVFGDAVNFIVEAIQGVIEWIDDFVEAVQIDPNLADAFESVCAGLKAAWDLAKAGFSVSLTSSMKILKAVLDVFGMTGADAAAKVADVLIKIRDWVSENTFLIGGINKLVEIVAKLVEGVKNLVEGFIALKPVQDFIHNIKEAFEKFLALFGVFESGQGFLGKILDFIGRIFFNFEVFIADMRQRFTEFGPDLIIGLVNGIIDNISFVINAMLILGQSIINAICSVLGIQSPSTVMFEIGQNVVQGLINGIVSIISTVWSVVSGLGSGIATAVSNGTETLYNAGYNLFTGLWNGMSTAWEAIKSFASGIGKGIADVFENIDWGVVTTIAGAAAAFFVLYRLIKIFDTFAGAVETLASPFKNLDKSIKNFSEGFKEKMKAKAFKTRADAVRSLAISIGILAASIYLLTKIDDGDMWKALVAVGAIIVLMGALVGAVVLLEKFSSFKANDLKGSLDVIAAIGKIAALFISIGGALALLAVSMKVIATMTPDQVTQAALVIGGFIILIGALVYATQWAGKADQIGKITKLVSKIGIALLLLAGAAKIFGTMSGDEFKTAALAIGGFMILMTMLVLATEFVGEGNVQEFGKTMIAIAASMGILAVAVKLLGAMDSGEIDKARVALTGLGILIVGLMMATQLVTGKRKNLSEVGMVLFGAAAAMGILAVAIKLLGSMGTGELDKAREAITGLGVLIVGLMMATQLAGGKKLQGVAATLLAASACVGILAGIAVLLGMTNLDTLAKGVVAVGALGFLVGFLVKATGKAAKTDIKGTMMGIAASLGILALSLLILSKFVKPEELIGPTIAMSFLLGFFALVEYASKFVKKSVATIVTMTVALGLMAAALFVLQNVDPQSAIANATALAILMGTLSGCLYVMGQTSRIAKRVLPGVAVLLAVLAATTAALWVLKDADPLSSFMNATALSIVLIALSGAIAIIGSNKRNLTKALSGIGVLSIAIVILAGALKILDGVDPLGSMGNALALAVLVLALAGAMTVLGGVSSSAIAGAAAMLVVSVGLIAMAAALRLLKDIPFGQIMAGVVGLLAVVAGLTIAGAVMGAFSIGAAALVVVLIAGSVAALAIAASFWIFSNALTIVGEALPAVGEGMAVLGAGVETFITKIADCAKRADDFALIMSTVGGSILGCLIQIAAGMIAVAGASVLLGTGAVVLGTGLVVASTGLIAASLGTVALSGAILLLCAAVTAGVVLIVGTMVSLVDFASGAGGDLVQGFADGINGALGTIVEAGANFVSSIASTICELLGIHSPSTVAMGWGQNTAEGYAMGLENGTPEAESSATSFIDKIKGVFSDDTTVSDALGAEGSEGANSFTSSLSEGLSGLDLSSMFGENGLDTSGIASLMKSEGTEGATNFGAGLTEGLSGFDFSSMLGTNGLDMSQLGSLMNTSGGDSADSFLSGFNSGISSGELTNPTTELLDTINSSSGDFTAAGAGLITAFNQGITDSTAESLESMGTLLESLLDAINDFSNKFKTAMLTAISNTSTAVNTSGYQSFWNAGASCARGFANGIAYNSYLATIKAKAMADDAVEAAKKALDTNSPSKVFMAIGQSVPEGFAKGVDKYGYYVNNSIESMATNALDNTKSVISRIGDALSNTDMDSQPTIRPVVDLSGVESGAAAINGMFGNDFAFGAKMNLNAISSSMHRRNQNGVNDDVVSAIDRLRKDVGNLENRSYSIGDITYSSGDEIGMAIETLTRAVMVGRRA